MAALFLPSRRVSQPGNLAGLNPAHPQFAQIASAFLFNNFSVVKDCGTYGRLGTYVAASAACTFNARAGLVGTAIGARNTGTNVQGYVDFGNSTEQPPGYSFGTGDFWCMAVFSLDGYVNSGSSLNVLWTNSGDNTWTTGWGLYTDSTNKIDFDVGSVLSGNQTAATYNDGRLHCAVGYRVGSTIFLVVDGIAASSVGSKSANVSSSSNYLSALNNSRPGFSARAWNGGIYGAAIGQGTLTADAAKALSRDPWNLWEPIRRQIWVDVAAGGTTNADVAAVESSDTAALAATVTTGADIAAVESSDTTAIVAANWTTAQLAATESSDTAAINATVTTGADIAAVESSDTTAIVADVTGATSAGIAATESSDTAALAATVTTGADILALEASDSILIGADVGMPVAVGQIGGGPVIWGPQNRKREEERRRKRQEERDELRAMLEAAFDEAPTNTVIAEVKREHALPKESPRAAPQVDWTAMLNDLEACARALKSYRGQVPKIAAAAKKDPEIEPPAYSSASVDEMLAEIRVMAEERIADETRRRRRRKAAALLLM